MALYNTFSMEQAKVAIVIPAYNEAQVLPQVLTSLLTAGFSKLVVVNDGSSDDTVAVCRRLGVVVVSHGVNLGVGAATRTGFAYVKKNFPDILYVATMDGDGQHSVLDLQTLLGECDGSADMYMGVRDFLSSGVPFIKKIQNLIADLITATISGVRITDTQSGLRLMKKESLGRLSLFSSDYAICSEIVIEALRWGWVIKSVKIPATYTAYSTSKPVKQSFINGLKVIKSLLSI